MPTVSKRRILISEGHRYMKILLRLFKFIWEFIKAIAVLLGYVSGIFAPLTSIAYFTNFIPSGLVSTIIIVLTISGLILSLLIEYRDIAQNVLKGLAILPFNILNAIAKSFKNTSKNSKALRITQSQRELLSKVNEQNSLSRIPLHRVMEAVRFIYSRKSVEKIFDPIFSDFCEEYYYALDKKKALKAKWTILIYAIAFLKAAGLFSLVKLVKFVHEVFVRA